MNADVRPRPVARPAPRLSIVTGSRRTVDLPAHILRRPASPVDFDTVSLSARRDLVRGLLRALHAGPIGSGLAAPMTGVGLRVVVSTASAAPMAMFNPRIVATDGPEHVGAEANLSLPGLRADVARQHSVTVEWQAIDAGRRQTATFEGWPARVLMHEIEILDGRLFIDHGVSPPLGKLLTADEQARQAVASVYGGETDQPPVEESLGLAVLPPSLHGLDGILTRPAVEVDHDQLRPGHLRSILQAMFRVLYEQRGVGLAAPQVGLGLRLVVIDAGESAPLTLINPRIVDHDEQQAASYEGCLSVPGWRGEVSRATAVKVRTDTVTGETIDLDLSGYAARIAQHEIDHVDGVLFTARMEPGTELRATDADVMADELLKVLERGGAKDSPAPAGRASSSTSSAKRKNKRRR